MGQAPSPRAESEGSSQSCMGVIQPRKGASQEAQGRVQRREAQPRQNPLIPVRSPDRDPPPYSLSPGRWAPLWYRFTDAEAPGKEVEKLAQGLTICKWQSPAQ